MQAIYYGQVEIIPGVVCDGYVLTDGSAVMSERGVADLLGMSHSTLRSMVENWPSKSLEPFVEKDLTMVGNSVRVSAWNSPYQGRNIIVYRTIMIENLIFGYALAFANDHLREHQKHLGKRAVTLMRSLVRTALEAAIQEACGMKPQIQKLAQRNYVDAIQVVRDFGLVCRLPGLATKAEISAFLKTPMGTLNYFLRNNQDEIQPVLLTPEQIQALGRKTNRLYGYQEEDVVKMVLGMDTEIGIDIKRRMLGEMGVFFKTQAKSEVLWRKELAKAFEDDGLYYNYPVGKYRVDFFIRAFNVCLECNGYSHRYYDQEKEKERERFILQHHALIRFYPKADLSLLFHSILHSQPGQLIHLAPVLETV